MSLCFKGRRSNSQIKSSFWFAYILLLQTYLGICRCLLSPIKQYFVKKWPLNCNTQAATMKYIKLPDFFLCNPPPPSLLPSSTSLNLLLEKESGIPCSHSLPVCPLARGASIVVHVTRGWDLNTLPNLGCNRFRFWFKSLINKVIFEFIHDWSEEKTRQVLELDWFVCDIYICRFCPWSKPKPCLIN